MGFVASSPGPVKTRHGEPPARHQGAENRRSMRSPSTAMPNAQQLAVTIVLTILGTGVATGVAQATQPSDGTREVSLTLADAIRLALRNNRTLLSARNQRAVQRFALEVNQDRYLPKAGISTSLREGHATDLTADISAGPTLRLPTGGELSLKWGRPLAGGHNRRGTWTLGLTQPLLKGAGTEIDGARLRIAHLDERKNALSFRNTVAGVLVAVITAYRSAIRAHHAISISRESLARARRQLEINQSLIDAGRLATREIVQTEAEIANRRLALAGSENGLISANATLISLLDAKDIGAVHPITDLSTVEPASFDLERSLETALANRPDYLRALLSRDQAGIRLDIAEDSRRWDLELTADVSRAGDGAEDFSTGIALTRRFGDRAPQLAELRARNTLRDAEIALVELRQSIDIAVRQAVHGVEQGFHRLELAQQARALAEQQVDVERKKLSQGLTSTFQLTTVEDGLVGAKTRELDTAIAYLNALTALEFTLGKTLEAWGVDTQAYALDPVAAADATHETLDGYRSRRRHVVDDTEQPSVIPAMTTVALHTPHARAPKARMDTVATATSTRPMVVRRALLLAIEDLETGKRRNGHTDDYGGLRMWARDSRTGTMLTLRMDGNRQR